MAVNLNKNKDKIVEGWRDVVNDKSKTDWALFGYEGQSNDLTFVSKGDGGIDELKDDLNSGKIMYAFVRVLDPKTSLPKFVLINWQGEGAPALRKGTCANHIRDVSNLLKGAHVTINARNDEEVDNDMILDKVSKSSASSYSFKDRILPELPHNKPVGTVYKKVNAKTEINVEERDKFWQREEEEEKKRQQEERRRNEEQRRISELEVKRREAEEHAKRAKSTEKVLTDSNTANNTQEAQSLIAQRNFDARAVFEQNTAAGQLLSRRLSSKGEDEVSVKTNQVSMAKQENNLTNQIIEDNKLNGNQTRKNIEMVDSQPIDEISQQTALPSKSDSDYVEEIGIEDTGLRAEALYDYQAADDTEISFDPGDIITHIEQVDPGWWQGLAPDNTYGLFPANYVQLL